MNILNYGLTNLIQMKMPAIDYLILCQTSDISPGQALKVETNGLVLAVFNVDNEFYVTDDLCTHGPGSLSESYILDDIVECDFHNGAFNIKTGEAVSAPCTERLKTYPVTLRNNQVCIDKPFDLNANVIPIHPLPCEK